MITLSIDEKDPHVLRVSASYLLALASEPVMTAEIANNVANIHNSIVDQIHGAPTDNITANMVKNYAMLTGESLMKAKHDLQNGGSIEWRGDGEIVATTPTGLELKVPPAFNAAELAEAEQYAGRKVTEFAKPSEPNPAEIFGGKPPVAPYIVGADPSMIAHADTTATFSIPTPPVEIVPPVPSLPSEGLAVALPTVVHAVDVDNRGLPWDSRIHSREKTKLQNGNWKNKRGIEPTFVAEVEAQLAALMAIPSPAMAQHLPSAFNDVHSPAHTMTQPETVIPARPPLAPAGTVIAPPNTPVVPAPPATTAPIVNLSEQPFPALMQKVTSAIAAKTLNNGQVLAIAKSAGFDSLPMLIPRPDLIPGVEALIDAQIAANIASGAPV